MTAPTFILHTNTQDNAAPSYSSAEPGAGLAALGQQIALLMNLQAALQRICGLAYGYNVTLGALRQLAGERPEQGTPLSPAMQEAEAVALLQVLQHPEVRAVLGELPSLFAADTSLEDIVQSLVVEHSSLQLLSHVRAGGGRSQA